MKCFTCKGDLEDKETTFLAELDKCIIIIKGVPTQVCRQCGEVSYTDQVAAELEKIVEKMKSIATEIAVADYRQIVA